MTDPVTIYDLVDPEVVVRELHESMTTTLRTRLSREGIEIPDQTLTSIAGELARNTSQVVLALEVSLNNVWYKEP